jgi:SAM-dependent methyltransferase
MNDKHMIMSQEPPPHTRLRTPSPWVLRHAALIPAEGRILDLACGGGRHTRYFLELGRKVTAIDRDIEWIKDLTASPNLKIIEADLEDGSPWPLSGEKFAAIIVANYLHRPLFPHLIEAVAPNGILIYETFARGNEAYSRPRNPDHLLEPGELLETVRGKLQILAYENGLIAAPRPSVLQRICAIRSDEPRSIAL